MNETPDQTTLITPEKLRSDADNLDSTGSYWVCGSLRAAADEIERLRGHVRQLRSVIEDALMWDGADDTGVDAVWRESAEEALKETK